MPYSSIGDFIPQLINLTAGTMGSLSSKAGGQNFTHCCLLAVNQSLSLNGPDGTVSLSTPTYFQPSSLTIPEIEHALSGDPGFPCSALQGSSPAVAPVVRVPYDWCLSECGGWEMSRVSLPQQWVGPLVKFILPSLAFCLSIPRASKLRMPNVIAQVRPWSLVWFATSWIGLLWALLLTVVDATVWLSICFTFAGPMLLSVAYESALDSKVLNFLDEYNRRRKRDGAHISSRLTAQLLLAVAVGNLRVSTGRRISIFSQWDAGTHRRRLSVGDILKDNTWSRVMAMVDEDESEIAWLGGKVRLSTKLKAILNSQSRFVHF